MALDGDRWSVVMFCPQDRQRPHAGQGCALRPALPSQYGRPADIVLWHGQSYNGSTLGPLSSWTVNIGIYTSRNCWGLTAALTTAISASARPRCPANGFPAAPVHAQHVVLDIEADGARDRIGHDQRRRGQEGLPGIRVDAPVEVAVAREHGGGVQARLEISCGGRRRGPPTPKPTASSSASSRLSSSTGPRFQPALGECLEPRVCESTQTVGIARQQAGGDHVAAGLLVLVQLVIAAMITAPSGIRPGNLLPRAGNALGRQVAGGDPGVGVARPGQVTHHARQVEAQTTRIPRVP
ncbi:hypothetical protein FQR65_LT20639 [Abscondita terminalis]|nr:hypothetical protein FQR65_LT20639 [Abscondita terminalis]